MTERETRRLTAWLLGGVLGFAALRFACTYTGLEFLSVALRRIDLGLPGSLYSVPWGLEGLAFVGIFTALAGSFMAVRLWGAPRQLWLSALVPSILQVAWFGVTVATFALMDRQVETLRTFANDLASTVPWTTASVFVLAAIGYPLAALLGCRLGSVGTSRSGVSEAATHA